MRTHDHQLENGAFVDFKVGQDEAGNPVLVSVQVSFEHGNVPIGGITSTILREVKTSSLMTLWFEESSRSFLPLEDEETLFQSLRDKQGPTGRAGLPDSYYAFLAYFYVQQCERNPNNPTSMLSQKLQVSTKTLATRLAEARKRGVLTSSMRQGRSTKAGGNLTTMGKKLIMNFIKENQ